MKCFKDLKFGRERVLESMHYDNHRWRSLSQRNFQFCWLFVPHMNNGSYEERLIAWYWNFISQLCYFTYLEFNLEMFIFLFYLHLWWFLSWGIFQFFKVSSSFTQICFGISVSSFIVIALLCHFCQLFLSLLGSIKNLGHLLLNLVS